jgi:hypothetical protein
VSFAYPTNPSAEQKAAALDLLSSLQHMLPCGECCSHYCSSFSREKIAMHLDSRDSFSRWLVDFHNSINRRLGKQEMTYEDVLMEYDQDDFCELASSCDDSAPPAKKFPWWIFLIICIIIIIRIQLT